MTAPTLAAAPCQWCNGEGCGVCSPDVAERNRAAWRRRGSLRPCRGCGREFDTLELAAGLCLECGKAAGQ